MLTLKVQLDPMQQGSSIHTPLSSRLLAEPQSHSSPGSNSMFPQRSASSTKQPSGGRRGEGEEGRREERENGEGNMRRGEGRERVRGEEGEGEGSGGSGRGEGGESREKVRGGRGEQGKGEEGPICGVTNLLPVPTPQWRCPSYQCWLVRRGRC